MGYIVCRMISHYLANMHRTVRPPHEFEPFDENDAKAWTVAESLMNFYT